MKRSESDQNSRRKFMSLGLLGGAGFLAQKGNAMIPLSEDSDTVQMLTPDGKLVEVSKKVLEVAENRTKVNNEDILNWTDSAKNSI